MTSPPHQVTLSQRRLPAAIASQTKPRLTQSSPLHPLALPPAGRTCPRFTPSRVLCFRTTSCILSRCRWGWEFPPCLSPTPDPSLPSSSLSLSFLFSLPFLAPSSLPCPVVLYMVIDLYSLLYSGSISLFDNSPATAPALLARVDLSILIPGPIAQAFAAPWSFCTLTD